MQNLVHVSGRFPNQLPIVRVYTQPIWPLHDGELVGVEFVKGDLFLPFVYDVEILSKVYGEFFALVNDRLIQFLSLADNVGYWLHDLNIDP
jgi:hypothetical protein